MDSFYRLNLISMDPLFHGSFAGETRVFIALDCQNEMCWRVATVCALHAFGVGSEMSPGHIYVFGWGPRELFEKSIAWREK